MRVLYDIQDLLEDELKKISKKEAISASDLENAYKIVDIIKDISTIKAMEAAEVSVTGDYSMDYDRSYNSYANNSYANNSYARSMNSRDGGYSERRGRDAMGRYTSREGGYSRHTKEDMIENLREMMREAPNEEEKELYRRALEQLSR